MKGPCVLRIGHWVISTGVWSAINDLELELDLRLVKVWRQP